jgi:hypothetical protein
MPTQLGAGEGGRDEGCGGIVYLVHAHQGAAQALKRVGQGVGGELGLSWV